MLTRSSAVCATVAFALLGPSLDRAAGASQEGKPIDLVAEVEFDLGQPIGQLRVAPVNLHGAKGVVLAYAADRKVDPYEEYFFYPTDTLKLAVHDLSGKRLWVKDLGRGMPPGMWFCPVFPFDLDGDGVDEIWCVSNPDTDHPFAISKYRLERLDAQTGETLGTWPWPYPSDRTMSAMFRNFILGGHLQGQPVLLTAQGTYHGMKIQAWNPDMSRRWEHVIAPDSPGARGSHMCPIVDFDNDGSEELIWGERLIDLATGKERFCADRDAYHGHSDIVQPFFLRDQQAWGIFTCREQHQEAKPRIVAYDHNGKKVWGDLDRGHIDAGWVAHLRNPKDFVAVGVRIGKKVVGPKKSVPSSKETFAYDAATGERVELPLDAYRSRPVDLNGDGVHEVLLEAADGVCRVVNAEGEELARVPGDASLIAHCLDLPGEHVFAYQPDGKIRVWRDRNAIETAYTKERFSHPFYAANVKLGATGYNLNNRTGL